MPNGPNRPSWRMPTGHGNPRAVFPPGVRSQFGDHHPNRRQCVAVARTTGKRCRKDALQGAKRCAFHRGHQEAYCNAPPGFVSLRTPVAVVRSALAKLGSSELFPIGKAWDPSPVKRGRIIEDEHNRQLGLTTTTD